MEQLIQFDENKNADLLNESCNIEMHSNSGDILKESCLFHIDEACREYMLSLHGKYLKVHLFEPGELPARFH